MEMLVRGEALEKRGERWGVSWGRNTREKERRKKIQKTQRNVFSASF